MMMSSESPSLLLSAIITKADAARAEEALTALIDRDGITCEMIPHPDYDLVTCSNCGHEDDTNIVYVIGGHVEYRGKFCTECGAPVREGGAR